MTVTRIKENRTVDIGGVPTEVIETVIYDYGKEGKTVVYIKKPADKTGSIEDLQRVLRSMGYELKGA